MKLTADFITTQATRRVMRALGEAYFVGGCVRNALMGLPVADIDIATPLHPGQVMARAEAAGLHVVPTGIEHGTVTLVTDGVPYEVTTYRRDVETDGRRATISFASDMREDAMRRDFTINALYAAADGTVIDPLGGLPDIAGRHIRFVGVAADRIREDYLRVLRFFRFAAHFAPGRAFDEAALDAIGAHLDGLVRLSAERVSAELLKLLAAPDPSDALAKMAELGVVDRLLVAPDADLALRVISIEISHGLAPDSLRRLAALTPDVSRLRLPKKDTVAVRHMQDEARGDRTPFELGYRFGPDIARAALILRQAGKGIAPPEAWADEIDKGAAARFPVRARDLPHLSGRDLGAELDRLEGLWVQSKGTLSRDELVAAKPSPPDKDRL